MASITHVPDNELIGFADRETEPKRTAAIEQHLEECDVCRDRLAAFRNAAETYRQFHEKVLKPGLAKPDVSWPRLRLDRAPRTKNQGLSRRSAVWWTSALAACLALAVLYLHKESSSAHMRTLLKRAENVTSGPHRRIELSIAGQRWYRPAVWRGVPIPAGLKHVEALFVNAHYGWEDPLSAHAFAAWRSRLRHKHDRMTSVHGADGMPRWYRLRTETNDGSLHIASLTLRADDLAAIHGAFEFADQEHVTIVDAGEIPESQPHSAAKNSLRTQAPEQAVGAADELRVFAALDRIGADVGEPLTIETDAAKQQVVVTGMGIRPEREREIRSALLAVPRTVARFLSGRARTGRHTGASAAESGAGYSADTNTAAHRWLEERAGGAQQLQSMTDQALEVSNSLLARAHALDVLAEKFPPDVEANFTLEDRTTLRELRHRHAIQVERETLELRQILKPLLKDEPASNVDSAETANKRGASWQAGARKLFESARGLDEAVSRLFGALDSEQAGENILSGLPEDVDHVEALAHGQATAQ